MVACNIYTKQLKKTNIFSDTLTYTWQFWIRQLFSFFFFFTEYLIPKILMILVFPPICSTSLEFQKKIMQRKGELIM